jgi:hypothetical protein
MRQAIGAVFVLLSVPALAAPWSFQPPLDVSHADGAGIFHHLGSGGRFGVAVSGDLAAVAWEDNRDGTPRCYVALLDPSQRVRVREWRVSGARAAYEPTVVGLPGGRFAVAWEDENGVWLRVLDRSDMGPPIRLDVPGSAHTALVWDAQRGLIAAWARPEGGARRIWLAILTLPRDSGTAPEVADRMPVEDVAPDADQLYPSVVSTGDGSLLVAWEDRRRGHTVIMAAIQADAHRFAPPEQINESFWGGRELGLGRGTGAMRVTLAGGSGQGVVAVWADKRDFRSGYDVYAAFTADRGSGFGPNEKVQDPFADLVAQWHPSVVFSGTQGVPVAAWDDDRNGDSDVWISWHDGTAWSDDFRVPGASGHGVQVEPALASDSRGGLHLAWVDKARPNDPSRVRYLYAPGDR